MRDDKENKWLHQNFWIFFVGFVGFFIFGKIGLALATLQSTASPIWPATGFTISFLARFGIKYWPAIFLSMLSLKIVDKELPLNIILFSIGSTLEGIIGFYTLKKINEIKMKFELQTQRKSLSLISLITVSLVAPLACASIGSYSLYFSSVISYEQFYETWFTWWVGNTVGNLVFYPIFSSLLKINFNKNIIQRIKNKFYSFAFSLITTIAILAAAFYYNFSYSNLFLLFPLILLVLYISNGIGLKVALLTVVIISVFATANETGPFVWSKANNNLLALQLFIFSLALTAYALLYLNKFIWNRYVVSILLFGWISTWLVFDMYESKYAEIDAKRFNEHVQNVQHALIEKLNAYEDSLESVRGLYYASSKIEYSEFVTFINTLKIHEKYPGINGIGYIHKVKKQDLNNYEKSIQKQIHNFKLHTVSEDSRNKLLPLTEDVHVIQYIVPLKDNQQASGLITSSEAKRKSAADQATLTGESIITDDITLAQDSEKTPGFLIFLPVYNNSLLKTNVEEKSKSIVGWIYAPFIIKRLMSSLVNEQTQELELKLYSQKNLTDQSLLYTSISNSKNTKINLSQTMSFEFGKRNFYVRYAPSSSFVSSKSFSIYWIVLVGSVLTLIISWILINLVSFKESAEKLVKTRSRELREKETLWRNLVQNLPVGIFQTDKNDNIVFFNKKWTEITNFDLLNFSNRNWKDVILKTPESKIWFNTQSAHGIEKIEHELKFVTDNNEERWINIILVQTNPENYKNNTLIGICIDISERINNEKAREIEKLKMIKSAKMAVLGEMASGIAHEINNPLTIINSKSSKLFKLLQASEHSNLSEDADKIIKMVKRISGIIKGLSAFSRDSSQDHFTKHTLQSIILSSLELCEERLKKHAITITHSCDSNIEIMCRPNEISQVLLNLFSNSFDAIEQLDNKWIDVTTSIINDKVNVTITDSGNGIPTDVVDKIMNPFFTTKEVGKGTGLGLSISKGIIENHKGRIYYNENSEHTCFVIELPLATSQLMTKAA